MSMSVKKELPFEQRQMNKKLIIKFLEVYRDNPCLWNTKCKDYNDRKIKKLGYEKLINLLKPSIPEVDKDYIVKKVNTLRSCFRKEYKKVVESLEKSSENPYRPSLWYYDLLLFTVGDDKYQTKSEKTELIFQLLDEECTNLNELDNQQDDSTSQNEEAQQNENIIIEIPDNKINYITKNSKRLKIEQENNNNSTHHITKCLNPSNLSVSKEQYSNPNNNFMVCGDINKQDDFHVFGVLVASKLRKISSKNETQQLFCENIINQALMKGLLGKLTEDSVIEC